MSEISGAQLHGIIEEVEAIEAQEAALRAAKAAIYAAAKQDGFDAPTLRRIVAERRRTRDVPFGKREAEAALLATYRAALGMLEGTPLGDAAIARAADALIAAAENPSPSPAGPSKAVAAALAWARGTTH